MSTLPQKIGSNREEAWDGGRAPGSAAPSRAKGMANVSSRKQTDSGSTPNAPARAKDANELDKFNTFNTKYQIRKKLDRIQSAYQTALVPSGDSARLDSQDGGLLLDVIASPDEGTQRADDAAAYRASDAS